MLQDIRYELSKFDAGLAEILQVQLADNNAGEEL